MPKYRMAAWANTNKVVLAKAQRMGAMNAHALLADRK